MAGLPPIRFHNLRHTSASILLNQGVPVITVSRRLGHAKVSITLDIYGHLIPTAQTGVAEMIDDLVMPVTVQLDKKVELGS
jgi:integrase